MSVKVNVSKGQGRSMFTGGRSDGEGKGDSRTSREVGGVSTG